MDEKLKKEMHELSCGRRQSNILTALSVISFPMHPSFCVDIEHSIGIKEELDRIIEDAEHLKKEYIKADIIREKCDKTIKKTLPKSIK